jgi:hypothetical protein
VLPALWRAGVIGLASLKSGSGAGGPVPGAAAIPPEFAASRRRQANTP